MSRNLGEITESAAGAGSQLYRCISRIWNAARCNRSFRTCTSVCRAPGSPAASNRRAGAMIRV